VLERLRNAFEASLGDIGGQLTEKAGADVTVSMKVKEAGPAAEAAPALAGAVQIPLCLGDAVEHNAILVVPAQTALVLGADDVSSVPDELTDESKARLAEAAGKIAGRLAAASGGDPARVGELVLDSGELGAGLGSGESVVEFAFASQGGIEVEFSVLASPAVETGASDVETAEPQEPEAQKAERAEFIPFEQPALGRSASPQSGIDLILDVPLEISVELGRVSMLIKDILALAPGSIVELGRTAGEPVDLLVNGRLVAKGEVVVIEDNFGIRVTEIVSPADRIAQAGGLAS
jgi:flagellar motor switch protein FliN